jgi:hypothetical protein
MLPAPSLTQAEPTLHGDAQPLLPPLLDPLLPLLPEPPPLLEDVPPSTVLGADEDEQEQAPPTASIARPTINRLATTKDLPEVAREPERDGISYLFWIQKNAGMGNGETRPVARAA